MEDPEIEALMLRLKKRGFKTDGVREHCDKCSQSAQWIYKTLGRGGGGRDIRWCLACGVIRSWVRRDDQLVEDVGFDLEKFLT
jgi:hypothetical protein